MLRQRNLLRDESGASAVEFALVASMLLVSIVFIMSTGLVLYYGQSMDSATSKAARQIMLGNIQAASVSQDTFRTNYICATLPSIFDCSKIIVNVQTITESSQPGGYYSLVNSNQTALIVPTSNSTAQYSPGIQQSYEYLQVVYPITFLPSPIAKILSGGATYQGSPAVMLVSTAAFRNEQY